MTVPIDRGGSKLEISRALLESGFSRMPRSVFLYAGESIGSKEVEIKDLLQMGYKIYWIALAYVLIYILCFIKFKRQQWRDLAHSVMLGCGISLGLIAVFGIAAFFNFDRVFLQFHLISFDNLYWQLDPTRDYLIMMFPQGFFYDTVIFSAIAIVTQALIVAGIAKGALALGKRAAVKNH